MRFYSLLLIFLFSYLPAQADQFLLKNGSTVRGKLINANEKPRETYQIRLDKGGEVTLDVTDVKRVIVPTPEQTKYRELLATMPMDSADLHWKMAEQCAKWSLGRERKFHLEQTVRLDPNHEPARRALKHKQREDGSWAELSVIMEEAGKVRQNGRWVTKHQAQLNEAAERQKEAEIAWKKKIKMWRKWLGTRREDEAIRQLSSIDDPAAVEPLVELFRSDKNSNLRDLLAEVLGRLNHGLATQALVEAAMTGRRDLQIQCLRQLEKNGRTDTVRHFVPYLRSPNNQLVGRAGYALSVLGDDQVILPLIKALNTTHTKLVGGAGDGGIGVHNGGISAGRTKPKKVNEYKENKEVRSALVKLTGQDFGYHEQRWLNWYLARSVPSNLDLRRDG